MLGFVIQFLSVIQRLEPLSANERIFITSSGIVNEGLKHQISQNFSPDILRKYTLIKKPPDFGYVNTKQKECTEEHNVFQNRNEIVTSGQF